MAVSRAVEAAAHQEPRLASVALEPVSRLRRLWMRRQSHPESSPSLGRPAWGCAEGGERSAGSSGCRGAGPPGTQTWQLPTYVLPQMQTGVTPAPMHSNKWHSTTPVRRLALRHRRMHGYTLVAKEARAARAAVGV